MVVTTCLDGKIDDDSFLLEFDMKIVFIFDSVRYFDSYLSGGLVPSVGDFIVLSDKMLFGDIFLTQFDDLSSRDGFEFGLLDSFEKIGHSR